MSKTDDWLAATGWTGMPAAARLALVFVLAVAAAGRTCTTSRSTRRYEASDFFADQRSARPLIEGTIAQGHLHEDELLYTGRVAGSRRRCFRSPSTRR